MHHFISDVARADEPVISNLPLDSEIPLLHVRRLRVVTKSREHARRWIRRGFARSERERIAAGLELVWIIETAGRIGQLNFSSPWRTLRSCQVQFGRFHIVEDAVAGANDHFPVLHRIPNQSDA